jgi:hypothetical protein
MVNMILFFLKHILTTVQRTESKVDALLRRQLNQASPVQPMNSVGQVDPLSNQPIKWQPFVLGDGSSVMVRLSSDQPLPTELPVSIPFTNEPAQDKES